MREIKFRFWDADSKIMTGAVSLGDVRQGFGPIVCDGERDIVMQFTGLKDKNGKEIYEGDICEYRVCGEPDKIRQISFEKYSASFRLGPDDYWESDKIYPESCEVIGNVYENPDLIDSRSEAVRSEASEAKP